MAAGELHQRRVRLLEQPLLERADATAHEGAVVQDLGERVRVAHDWVGASLRQQLRDARLAVRAAPEFGQYHLRRIGWKRLVHRYSAEQPDIRQHLFMLAIDRVECLAARQKPAQL